VRKTFLVLALVALTTPLSAAVKGTVMNMAGAPLAGARVEAYLPESSEARAERFLAENPRRAAIASATTDTAGNFSLDVKKQPAVDVAVEAAGHEPFTLVLAGDDDAGAIALRVAPRVTGLITASGKPIANARVMFLNGISEHGATTDAEGRYTAPDPRIWALQMRVHHPEFAPLLERTSGRKLSPNQKLVPGISVSGRVLAEDGRTPVAGAKVTAGSLRTVSGEDGTFTLLHVPEPRPVIRATIGDRIAADNTRNTSINLRLAKAGSISGLVRDAATQRPLQGVRVALGLSESAESAVTNSAGAFTLANILPGRHRITAVFPNFTFAGIDADVRAGDKVTRTLAGTQNATVTGTVTDEAKRVVPAALLSVAPLDEPMGPSFRAFLSLAPAYSAPDGRFVLRNVPPNQQVEVLARKKGVPSGTAGPLMLTSGQLKRGVNILLPRGLTVTGKVTDQDGRPLSGVEVIPREAEGPLGPMQRVVMRGGPDQQRENHVETGNDGGFALQLKQGKYDILFQREGYATKRIRSHPVIVGAEPLEVSLQPGVEITGRVVRQDGSGVPDVNVGVMGLDADPQSHRTAPDGSFTLSNLSPGTVMIIATKPEDFIREMRNVTAPARDLLIRLPAGGRVEGRVVEKSSKRPITQFRAGPSGAAATGGMRFVGPRMLRNFTSEDGSFVLDNVPPGRLELIVEAPGYVEGRVPGLLVEEGKTIGGVEVALDTGVRLFGRVTGPDGAAVPGVLVSAEEDRGLVMMTSDRTTTDGAGEYAIEAVEPAEKTFIFRKEGFLTERKTVKLAGREVRLDVRLSRGREVTGTVVDENGVPLAGASVSARSAVQDSGMRITRTDSNGAFRFEGLAPGRYTFRAEKSGYVTGEARDIDLDAAMAGVRISLTGGGTIVGLVRGLPEREFSTVVVSAVGSMGGRPASGRVDSSGAFRIEGVPTGTVRVSATAGDFTSRRVTAPQSVEVAAGSEVTVDLEFKSDVLIRGRVSRQGRPLDNAMVVFNPLDAKVRTRSSTRTGANGIYEISGLEPGRYEVGVIDMQRFASFDTTYEVVGSATFDIDVRGSEIRGRVVDSDSGQPIADATVTLQKASAEPSFLGNLSVVTDAAGNFSFDTVSPGSYRARAQKERYGQSIVDLVVSESDSRDIELKLARNDGALLRVVDARDGRSLSASVWIRDQQGRSAFEGQPRPNSDGVLVIPLGPGGYRATVGATGYAAQSVNLVVPSQEIRIALSPGGTIQIESKQNGREVARLMTPSGDFYRRSPWTQPQLVLDPGTTVVEHLVPGAYVLQLLDERGNVKSSYSVTVVEGRTVRVEI
jgi:protocatechuate 3,4-dioxygenase beta subunit